MTEATNFRKSIAPLRFEDEVSLSAFIQSLSKSIPARPSGAILSRFQDGSVLECVAGFLSQDHISVVERIESNGPELFEVDFAVMGEYYIAKSTWFELLMTFLGMQVGWFNVAG